MSDKQKQLEIVRNAIRKATIDLNQAETYFQNSQYEGYEKNLNDVVTTLSDLIEKTKSRID